jgi:LytS/YehU family sensor histidine kinase
LIKKKKPKEGVGLKITRERLAHLFGTDHLFVLENLMSGGVKVTIRIPFINSAPMVILS